MTLSDHNGLLSDYKYYFYNVLKYVTILIGAATPPRANFSDLICICASKIDLEFSYHKDIFPKILEDIS